MINIAIDGPAGTGKSTVAKLLKEKLKKYKFIYLDTGAIYRGVAYYLIKNISRTDIDDARMVGAICEDLGIGVEYIDENQHIFINGEDVTKFIRDEEVTRVTSKIAGYKEVRESLINIQRDIANKYNIIMDGRDIGTKILPNADLKIYLTAIPEIRAKRRYDELKNKSIDCNYDEILSGIIDRDTKDMNRSISPLKKADDAVVIDTTEMGIDDVVNLIASYLENDNNV